MLEEMADKNPCLTVTIHLLKFLNTFVIVLFTLGTKYDASESLHRELGQGNLVYCIDCHFKS